MKKSILFFVFASILLSFSFTGPGPDFEGKIAYSISVEGGNMPPEAMAMFAGGSMTMYIKKEKSRSEMVMGFQNSTTISDAQAGTSVVLIDIMGNKYKMTNSGAEGKKKESGPQDITIKELNETRQIAGYECKKHEITFTDKGGAKQSTVVYATEQISNRIGSDGRSSQFKGLKGMPLEFEIQTEQGMKMKMTAQLVSKESVPDSKFEIPTGYKESTQEEMQRDVQKGMQQR